MTWFKVDDSFYDHPKVFDAPDCALALWVRAGCWSARNLTDGFVPASLPARLCDDPDTAVRALVDRGLWKRARGGYQFHDWTEYQPSADSVKDLRRKRADAGKKGGQAKAAKQSGSKSVASASGVAKQNAAPSRPDPSRRDGGSVDRSSSGSRRARENDDEDDLIEDQIIGLLQELTGQTVDHAWASRVRHQILDGRTVDNPARYIAASIRGEPGRYLPAPEPGAEAGNAVIQAVKTADPEQVTEATRRGAAEARALLGRKP